MGVDLDMLIYDIFNIDIFRVEINRAISHFIFIFPSGGHSVLDGPQAFLLGHLLPYSHSCAIISNLQEGLTVAD